MSKIAKKPIKMPEGVSVSLVDRKIHVLGPLGELSFVLPKTIKARVEENRVFIAREGEEKATRSLHGLFQRLVSSGAEGVSQGWEKTLELVGTGYRARMDGKNIILSIGFSHPVTISPPEGISLSLEENRIKVSGIDKHMVGQVAANIRKIRPPEPYKGKGIRYLGEAVRRKPGKAAKVGAVA